MPNDRDYPVSIRVRKIGRAITAVAVVCGIYLLVQFVLLAKLGNLFGKPLQIGRFVQTSSYIWSYNAQPVTSADEPARAGDAEFLPRRIAPDATT